MNPLVFPMRLCALIFCCWLSCLCPQCHPAFGQDQSKETEVRTISKRLIDAFNSGKPTEISALFLNQGEIIDERGTVHQGQVAISQLLTEYFAKFPGVKAETSVDSIRLLGPIAIEEGSRTTITKDGVTAQVLYTAVYSKSDQGWRIASIRDLPVDPGTTPGEMLQSLSWLVGEWVNEGVDAKVKLSYKWSEDSNFILGEISVTGSEKSSMKSTQRIAWDPIAGSPRSWTFDSDGGYAESKWTEMGDNWLIRTNAVLPDGTTGSASVTVSKGVNGRYVMKGTNRIVGNVLEEDYEITVVKSPPASAK